MGGRPFDTCWERIERADAHAKAFGGIWNGLLEDDPYEAHVEVDSHGQGRLWVERRIDRLPASLALEFGEMLYQYRAALDACIYQSAILETGQDPPPDENALEFPICATEANFRKSARRIKPITDKHRLAVIESVQPYKTPELADNIVIFNFNRTLAILNDWARKDRHRNLHVIGSWGASADPKFKLPDGVSLDWYMVTYDGFLEHDGEIAVFQVSGWKAGMNIQANPDMFIDVAIDESPTPSPTTTR